MNEKVVNRVKLENELHHALKNDEMIIYYQPKIELKSGLIAGMEALVRWKKENGEVVAPGLFLPLAEETGLICAIDKVVLEKTCGFIKKVNNIIIDKSLTISINFSAKDFEQMDLTQLVIVSINKWGILPEQLELEVTESTIMKNMDKTWKILRILQEFGLSVSLDDFGTGYSSLSYLTKLPINIIKVDRTFTMELPEDSKIRSITKAITTMAHELKMSVIVEGVERKEQVDFLQSIKCDFAQGYYYSQPVDESTALAMLTGQKKL